MKIFENAKWIWYTDEATADSYGDFRDSFTYCGGHAEIRLSCDSDYTLFVNGYYASSSQYGDFEHYKIYDTVDVTRFLDKGENRIDILVHHYGASSSRYRPAPAGLIYEVELEGKVAVVSSENTLSRQDPAYESGRKVRVTSQLGFSFAYDATKETEEGFTPAVCVEKNCTFFPRPIKKHAVLPRAPMKSVTALGECDLLIDLGGENVGFPVLELVTKTSQKITVAWGEHIEDGGRVRMIVGGRNFSYEYTATEGHNEFNNYMLRLGCRYIEVMSGSPVELIYAGVLPQEYEVDACPVKIDSELDRRIYDVCVNTLRKSMMEHYVDCPWREQALYAFDSRNQMLCGYYAFEDGNAEYARANLKLIGEDRRDDGLLSICYPAGGTLAIPSFSLYYLMEMREYLDHTGDTSLAKSLIPKMKAILDEFIGNSKDGLVCRFEGDDMWNFYDWTKITKGSLRKGQIAEPDVFVNALFIISLENFKHMCERTGEEYPYGDMADVLRARTKEEFLTEGGIFTARRDKEEFAVLGNTLAILAGVVAGDDAAALCERIVDGSMEDCTLSMKVLEYEALLNIDTEKYRGFVLDDIRRNYKMMLDYGHDTFWETIEGASAFSDAGSLCHGWSAVPIYIFHRLGIAK